MPPAQSLSLDVSSEVTHNVDEIEVSNVVYHNVDDVDTSSVVNHNLNEESFFSRSHDIMCMDRKHELNRLSTLSQSKHIKNSLHKLLSEF